MQTNLNNVQKIRKQQQRRKDYYLKIWGISENKSLTDQHRFTNQYPPEPRYLPKNRFLKDWNWKQNFKSLEEAQLQKYWLETFEQQRTDH